MMKLCADCCYPGTITVKDECEWCRVSPEMARAWADYEPPAGFDFEGGYNECVVLIRHAFMTGYCAASVDTHPKGGDVQQAPAPLSGAVPQGDAQGHSQSPSEPSA